VRYIEPRLAKTEKPDTLGTPDILLLLSEEVAIVDNLSGKLTLVVYAEPEVPGAYKRAQKRLRELLDMSRRVEVKSIAADILYNAPDPFARKVILDRGAQQGVEAGLAVVDAKGVVGQVTRVHPVQSEVTLLTDRNQSIPVSVLRNGVRGVLFGSGQGGLEMRFVLADADVREGDQLVTSGLDGVFVPGLPVAKVVGVDRASDAFARIECEPLAAIETSVQVLVIGRTAYPPPPPALDARER
jgi:rod shape-determining protein MreC